MARASDAGGRRTLIGARRVLAIGLLAAVVGSSPRAEPPPADPPGRHFVLSGSGAPPVGLYYEEKGAGPPVLLVHGLGESTFTWHEILPALATGHRVIALDLKGFGRSDKPDDGAYSADDQAALVARFIIEQDLRGLTVIGHSFGGTVALRTALVDGIAGTDRVRRLVVIGAPALPGSTPGYLDLVKTPLLPDAAASAISPEAMARLLLREAMGGKREASDDDIEGYAAPYRDPAAMRAFLATARGIVREGKPQAVARRYGGIRQPVLLVWCREDEIVPLKAGRRLDNALPRARLVVLEGCHHLPQHERPQALLKALSSFLEK